jgi:hypothetical protein
MILAICSGCAGNEVQTNSPEKQETLSTPIPELPGSTENNVKMHMNLLEMIDEDNQRNESSISILQEQILFFSLHNAECKFPCYLGINIEGMNISEALIVLQGLGASMPSPPTNNLDSGLVQYVFTLDIVREDEELRQTIFLLVKENVILRAHASIENRAFPEFLEYWSEYLLQDVLFQTSEPDFIFVNTANYMPTLTIQVIDQILGLKYSVILEKNQDMVCFGDNAKVISVSFSHFDPEKIELISSYDNLLDINPDENSTVPEIFKITKEDFIYLVLQESNACLEINEQ